jgi:hypothetical protein
VTSRKRILTFISLTRWEKYCLAGPDADKKHPQKDTEQYGPYSQQPAKGKFKFYGLFFLFPAPGHDFITGSKSFFSYPEKIFNKYYPFFHP